MSLSQASSPEEAKRELKQQVFLAIQGKYDPRQTSQLIEDIDTLTNAIENNKSLIAKSMGVPKNLTGSDTLEIASFMNVGQSKAIRDLIADGALKVLSRQSDSEALDKASAISKAIDFNSRGCIPITKRETLQEAADRTASKTSNMDFLFLGSSDEEHIGGTVESVPVCSNGTPINSRVRRPMPTERGMGMADYYLREISIDAKARPVKVYFYATNNYLDNWSEQKLLDTIKRISLFYSR